MENPELGFNDEIEELLQSLPKETSLISGLTFHCYKGFWVTSSLLKSVVSFQNHFVALDDNLLLASCPKSGTTWLKSLAFSIVNRSRFLLSETPLVTANPHALVLNPEFDIYNKPESFASLHEMSNPRLLCSHVPYSMLPPSVRDSECKIVYICRNPLDQFVSSWLFASKLFGKEKDPAPLTDESIDHFCRGVHLFGPFWDHVLEFWEASLEKPRKIFFVKYEDLKNDAAPQVKRLAEFLGFPFSEEEEKQGLVEEIIKLCSIENMKTLEGNIHGKRSMGTPHGAYFRKGEVGDWANHLPPWIADRLKKLVQDKFASSSLQML